jgi:hypothetical protein
MTPLQQQITELWGQITAATHRFLELVAELDEKKGWNGAGMINCAHWLNVYCGIGMVAAREKVRVAHALRLLPGINGAFREGRVSYSKVRAMTRVATPENESVLLNVALHGTAAHVERTVRGYRRVELLEEGQRAAAAHRERYLQFRYLDDERQIVHGVLPVEVAELVRQAIDRAVECLNAAPDDSAESWGARRADALKLMASQFLGQRAEEAGSSDRYQVVVHIDHELLRGAGACVASSAEAGAATAGAAGGETGSAASDKPAGTKRVLSEFEDGPALAVATARRLACDCALVGMVDDADGGPLNVGRRTRAIPPALKRALKSRDKGCRFPGCPHTRYTEGHHIHHWANGGKTKLGNLVTLCDHHHNLVHEGGYRVDVTDDGVFRFFDPEGAPVHEDFAVTGRFRGIAIGDFNRERGIHVTPGTIVTRWQGERMDYSTAIGGLLAAKERAAIARAVRGEL